MDELKLSENPEIWTNIYEGYRFRTVEELGARRVERTSLLPQESPPGLKELRGMIDDFWGEYCQHHPQAWNSQQWMARGISDLSVRGSVMEVKAFPADYATMLFAGPRGLTHEKYLNADQRYLLSQLKVLGAGSYTREQYGGFLIGTKAGMGITGGLLELVPMGMLDADAHKHDDPFLRCLERELQEETGLTMARDVEEFQATHVEWNDFYPEMGAIYSITLRPGSSAHLKVSPEHSTLEFMSPMMLQEINPGKLNPCSAAILRAVGVCHGKTTR